MGESNVVVFTFGAFLCEIGSKFRIPKANVFGCIHESEQYMKYIATRPRDERTGTHGLFDDEDAVSLDKAMEELESYTGKVWTHIISQAGGCGLARLR